MSYSCTTVITKEGKWFVSRCVELGVTSQGKTLEQAQKNLQEAVELYLEDSPRSRQFLSSRRASFITTLEIKHG